MNYLASFITSFCAACVFIGALYMLAPDGVMHKSVKYILTLVFVLSVISAAAITAKNRNIEIDKFSAEEINTAALDEETAHFVFESTLKGCEIEFSKITVCTNKTESGSISISKVIICTHCPEEKIMTALNGLTENIEVVVEND